MSQTTRQARGMVTDAQRAGMTEEQWTALTDEQRSAEVDKFATAPGGTVRDMRNLDLADQRRLGYADFERMTEMDATRAGLTMSQWTALTPAQRHQYREAFPNPNPPIPPITTPSPPDPNNLAALGTQAGTEHAHVSASRIPAADDDDFSNLPNTPGGRNNPSLSFYDPTRPDTD